MDELDPEIKEKTLEIAKKLVVEKGYSRENAIKQGIMKAEEWFYGECKINSV